MQDIITLDYGSGGKKTSELIEKLIKPAFSNETLDELGDAAGLDGNEKLLFSTDSFVVNPYFFPGGDIGKLAVCGTVNDIAVSGGIPKYLSLGLILEEGLSIKDLEKITDSIKKTADEAGVKIVTGDTKVVEKGKGDSIYINTAGIGFEKISGLSKNNIKENDAVIVSGTVGEHGIAVMLARNANLVNGDIKSDCAPVLKQILALERLEGHLRIMRDPTRGGVATTLCEFVEGTKYSIELEENKIPVSKKVKAACDILGLDPLYCACEGRFLLVVSEEKAAEALKIIRNTPGGKDSQIIGKVTAKSAGRVLLNTEIGGARILSKLSGAQLPRIC